MFTVPFKYFIATENTSKREDQENDETELNADYPMRASSVKTDESHQAVEKETSSNMEKPIEKDKLSKYISKFSMTYTLPSKNSVVCTLCPVFISRYSVIVRHV